MSQFKMNRSIINFMIILTLMMNNFIINAQINENWQLVEAATKAKNNDQCNIAIPLYEKAIKLVPEDTLSAYYLAHCFFQEKSYIKASEYFVKLTFDSALEVYGYYGLAAIAAINKDMDKGIENITKLVDAKYNDGESLLKDKDLDYLKSDRRFHFQIKRLLGKGYDPDFDGKLTPDIIRSGTRYISNFIQTNHYAPYRQFSRNDWNEKTNSIIKNADNLNATDYLFELISLASMANDVHTSIYPERSGNILKNSLPVRFWKFNDGLFIRAASPEYKHLVGAEVVKFSDNSIDTIWPLLLQKFPYENPSMSSYQMTFFLLFPEFHHYLGLSNPENVITITLKLSNGKKQKINLQANQHLGYFGTMGSGGLSMLGTPKGWTTGHEKHQANPLWLKNAAKNYFYEVLNDKKALFLQVNTPRDNDKNPWIPFLDEAFQTIDDQNIETLIIDLRHNPGGYHYMLGELVHKVIKEPKINKPGHLFVLISRETQSAGVSFAAALERETSAIFVGEAVGAAPNFLNAPMGNHTQTYIPGTKFRLRHSTGMQQESDALDTRITIAPDVPTELTYENYSQGEDPALIAIWSLSPKKVERFFRDPGGRIIPQYFRWRRPSQKAAFLNAKVPRDY